MADKQVSVGSQISKALAVGSYFFSGCLAVNAFQALGSPLYLVNKDWYNAWISFTKQAFGLLTITLTQFWAPTMVKVSGDESVRGQLLQTVDGNLLCNFPQRLVLMANHQIYTDWLYLWWAAYASGMHGRVYIVLKESLRHIPVIGWGMQLSRFIFLKRNWEKDKPRLSAHLQTLNKSMDPMWLILFPEGTNLAPCTRERSREWAEKRSIKDMQHQLLPRYTGLQFCLQELRSTVGFVYDCTIGYEGVERGEFAQDIYTLRAAYAQGRPPKTVHMYWRRFPVSSIPLDDPVAFEVWLRARWMEKDRLLEIFMQTGHFPADRGFDKTPNGKTRRGAGEISTQVKALHWYEMLQVFAPVGLLGLVLYAFYNALPNVFLKSIDKLSIQKRLEAITKLRLPNFQRNLLTDPTAQKYLAKYAKKQYPKLPFDISRKPEATSMAVVPYDSRGKKTSVRPGSSKSAPAPVPAVFLAKQVTSVSLPRQPQKQLANPMLTGVKKISAPPSVISTATETSSEASEPKKLGPRKLGVRPAQAATTAAKKPTAPTKLTTAPKPVGRAKPATIPKQVSTKTQTPTPKPQTVAKKAGTADGQQADKPKVRVKPAASSASKSAGSTTSKPAASPASKLASKSAPQATLKPVAKPAAKPLMKPATNQTAKFARQLKVNPIAKPAAKQNSAAAPKKPAAR